MTDSSLPPPPDIVRAAYASLVVTSLADARRMAADFLFLRTLRQGVLALAEQYDLTPLMAFDANLLDPGQPRVLTSSRCARGCRSARPEVSAKR